MTGDGEISKTEDAGPDQIVAAMDLAGKVRLAEALLFAGDEPLGSDALLGHLGTDTDLSAVLSALSERYQGGGIELVQTAAGWSFRTAEDLAPLLRRTRSQPRKLSRAAIETLAIIAYHQTERPVTRLDIETIRGVALSKGTLDVLMEAGFVRPGRRRPTPGRPLTWGVTPAFLDHVGLLNLDELPGLDELRQSGLLDTRPALATLPGGRMDDLIDPDGGDEDLPPTDGSDIPLFAGLVDGEGEFPKEEDSGPPEQPKDDEPSQR